MIKANELRIGNLLYSDSSRNPAVYKVMGVDIESDHVKMEGDPAIGEVELIYMVPIPLTPEWLERCGFVKKNMLQPDFYTWWKDGMGEYLTFHHDGFCVFEFGNRRIISHLHQLQNLYFALTGEEIIIKNYK